MTELVPKKANSHDTSDLLAETIKSLTQGITGIAASERKDLFLSLGHILQRIRSGRFLEVLKREWDGYRDKGRIKEDYMDSDQHQECLQEMLDFLDKDSPDEIRFSFLKKIFLTAATETISDRESVLPQQYMRVCRGLSAGEVLVLEATFGIAKSGGWDRNDMSAQHWENQIAEKSTLQYTELVELHERNLINKNLITPRTYSDKSGVRLGRYYHLSNLGYEICKFIEAYQDNAHP